MQISVEISQNVEVLLHLKAKLTRNCAHKRKSWFGNLLSRYLCLNPKLREICHHLWWPAVNGYRAPWQKNSWLKKWIFFFWQSQNQSYRRMNIVLQPYKLWFCQLVLVFFCPLVARNWLMQLIIKTSGKLDVRHDPFILRGWKRRLLAPFLWFSLNCKLESQPSHYHVIFCQITLNKLSHLFRPVCVPAAAIPPRCWHTWPWCSL